MCCQNSVSKKTACAVPIYYLCKEALVFLVAIILVILLFTRNDYQKVLTDDLDGDTKLFLYVSLVFCPLNIVANALGLAAIVGNKPKWIASYFRFILISFIINIVVWCCQLVRTLMTFSNALEWTNHFILLLVGFVFLTIGSFCYCIIHGYRKQVCNEDEEDDDPKCQD